MTTTPMPPASSTQTPPAGSPSASASVAVPAEAPAYGLQAQGSPWWKGALSLLAIAAAYLVVSVALGVPAMIVASTMGLTGTINPATMLAVNLSWAAMIWIAPALMRAIHRVPRGSMSSVDHRVRWGRVGRTMLWVVPLYAVANVVFWFVHPTPGGAVTAAHVAMIGVVLLTTPLQAAGEEYTFRGAAQASAATWGAGRVGLLVGGIVSSVLFGLAHGATDPWLFGYYIAFGVGMVVLTRLTRGLEASVVVHAVNNVLAMVVGALVGTDFDKGFDRSVEGGNGGPVVLVPLAFLLVACVIAWLVERRRAGRMAR